MCGQEQVIAHRKLECAKLSTVERNNISGWVSSLERVFDLEATEESDRIVIRAR